MRRTSLPVASSQLPPGKVPTRIFGPLDVLQQRHHALLLLGGGAHPVGELAVRLVVAVREVEAGDVHPRRHQLADALVGGARRAEGGDDLGLAFHAAPSPILVDETVLPQLVEQVPEITGQRLGVDVETLEQGRAQLGEGARLSRAAPITAATRGIQRVVAAPTGVQEHRLALDGG
jgi:hypothetical protein